MLILLLLMNSLTQIISHQHPHAMRSVWEIIRINGYPAETHYIVTQDGYILALHRIAHGLKNMTGNGPPVLLMHGILQSSAEYVVMGPERAMGFILADLGYDVWLGNSRGNLHSRNHTRLSPEDPKFWEFSFDDIGYYDLPASIDYILRHTGYNKLHIIGHSQGSTAVLVMLSQKPKYNNKIRLAILLAPCSYMQNVIHPFLYFAFGYGYKLSLLGLKIIGHFTHGESLRHSEWFSRQIQSLCNEKSIFREVCATMLFCVVGFSYRLMDYSLLPSMLSNTPAGGSIRQYVHYMQNAAAGTFRRFDHGHAKNMEKYGQAIPPDYKLWSITAPIAIFYGDYDVVCCTKDIMRLYSELPNPVYLKKITEEIFNHVDFVWTSRIIIQKFIVDIMSKY